VVSPVSAQTFDTRSVSVAATVNPTVHWNWALGTQQACQLASALSQKRTFVRHPSGLLQRHAGKLECAIHARFKLAEVAVPRTLFAEILRLICDLRLKPAPP
jgi:hypothetical protein